MALQKQKKEEEERKKAEEIALQKKIKSQENQKLRKLRSKLRNICKNCSFTVLTEDVELLCSKLNLTQMTELVKAFEDNEQDGKQLFSKHLDSIKEEAERLKKEAEEKEKEEKKKKESKPWTEKELSLLAQGIAKFPGGVKDRWNIIANFVGTRSVKEIIAKANETKTATKQSLGNIVQIEDEFSKSQQAKKKTQEISAEITKRDPSESQQQTSSSTQSTQSTDPSNWTAVEQKQLEQALVKFPASTPERWDQIAESIPTRSKKECIQRFKYLVSQIKAKK